MLMFGGQSAPQPQGQPLGDTWAWTTSGWRKLSPAHEPPARIWPAMAWDPTDHVILLFGSPDGPARRGLTDTWAWDGHDWTELHPNHAPEGSAGPFLTYDQAHSRMLLVGVYGGGDASGPATWQTWAWSTGHWLLVNPSTPASVQVQTAWDPAAGHVVLSGIGTGPGGKPVQPAFTWDGQDWLALTAGAPGSTWSIATDYRRGRLLAMTAFKGTFAWDGVSWTRVHADDDPNLDVQAAFAWNPDLGSVLEYGVSHDGKTYVSDVYAWSGATWQAAA